MPGLADAAVLLQTFPVIPGIRYATSGDLQIAYQVVGDGPVDVVFAFDWAGNIELMWENPQTERFLRRFASYGRLIFFDMRGVEIEAIRATWGTTDPLHLRVLAPDLSGDEFARAWWARVERAAGSPRRAVRKQQLAFQLDVRDVLEAIAVPTLVVQSAGNRFVISAQGRYLAEHIPRAQYLELASGGHWPWAAPDADRFLDKLEEFLTGAPQVPSRDRVLATVAFTDIVDSTALAASMGDRRWRELLEVHDSVARREVEAARGRTVKSTGDGLLATFDGPARAIRCTSGQASTPARSSCSATTSAASPSPLPLA